MNYIPPITEAPYRGKIRKNTQGIPLYPLKRRGLSTNAKELGRLIQGNMAIPAPNAVGRDPYVRFVCNDLLSELTAHIPNATGLYVQRFSPFITNIYEMLLSGEKSKMPNGFYAGLQGRVNACILVDYFFNQKLRVIMNPANLTIDPRLLSGDHKAIFDENKCGGWDDLFSANRLASAAYMLFDFSAARAIMAAFHWAFDLSKPEGQHIHSWDFTVQNCRIDDSADGVKKTALLHILTKHIGLLIDPKKKEFDRRLLPENQEALLASHKCSDWTEMSRKYGFSKFTRWGKGQQEMNKIFQLFKDVFPWMFDYSTPEGEHLHYADFKEEGMFSGPNGRDQLLQYIGHLLEAHYGLQMDEEKGVIDNRLFSLKGQKQFLQANGFHDWHNLIKKNKLYRYIPQVKEFRGESQEKMNMLFINTLRRIYPWAFDLKKPEGKHLHFWAFPYPSKWDNSDVARTALEHEMKNHNISLDCVGKRCHIRWFKTVKLGGLVFFHNGSPLQVFKALYPEKFIQGILKDSDFTPNPFFHPPV